MNSVWTILEFYKEIRPGMAQVLLLLLWADVQQALEKEESRG